MNAVSDNLCCYENMHKLFFFFATLKCNPANIYLFKVNNRNTIKNVKYVQS